MAGLTKGLERLQGIHPKARLRTQGQYLFVAHGEDEIVFRADAAGLEAAERWLGRVAVDTQHTEVLDESDDEFIDEESDEEVSDAESMDLHTESTSQASDMPQAHETQEL